MNSAVIVACDLSGIQRGDVILVINGQARAWARREDLRGIVTRPETTRRPFDPSRAAPVSVAVKPTGTPREGMKTPCPRPAERREERRERILIALKELRNATTADIARYIGEKRPERDTVGDDLEMLHAQGKVDFYVSRVTRHGRRRKVWIYKEV